MKGVYTDIISICEALKQVVEDCDQNSVSISFVRSSNGASIQNLDQPFIYSQILKEILLTIDIQEEHIKQFLTYCREQFVGINMMEIAIPTRLPYIVVKIYLGQTLIN